MGKFNEYSQKATPEDADTLMIYDAAAKANKLSPFSGIWNWIVGKLTNAVISNLQTRNRTVVGALNEINDVLPVGGIYDLDNPPKKMIFSAMAGSTNLPNGFGGANAVTVIQMNLGVGNFNSMIAFSFAVDKIAIRRKNGTKNWSEWKYFNTAEILSNLTTTNKSSLVGAINELNSNPFLRYEKTFGDSLTIKNVRAATHGLIIIEKSMIVFYLGGSVSIGYTVTTSALPEGITVNNSDRTVTIKSTKTQMITCFYAFL